MTMTSPQVAARAGAAVPAGRTNRRGGRPASRRSWAGWWFIGPFMAVFALVFLAPIAYSIYLSVFRNQLIGGTAFVGLDNYARALGDPQFWSALGRVSLFLAVQVPVMLMIALVVALALDSGRLYGRSFFRISIFLPYAVPAVVATLMWGFMYGTRFGLVGNINQAFGLNLPSPLSSELVLASIGNIVTWEFIGYNMLIFYSALTVIPKSLYEAAEIDGAGQLRVIAAIKLPAIRGAIVVATIFSVIGSFQLFNEPSILKSLSPNTISTFFTPNLYAFSLSFSGQQYNYSATVAIIMGLITMAIAYAVQVRGMRKER
ncbi:carbohydrate ABC transporter permease [Arthrobacter sp.]|uniref:carbohydrate ABC transporter permease n=1 Tax=Arthrobacter sp. TaxID=1667 RepID=UPI0039C8B8B6